MEVKEVGQEAVDRLYPLWKKTSKRYAHRMSEEEFIHHFFENPSTRNISFLAKDDDTILGAMMLESLDWGAYLYDWIVERDRSILENIFERGISSFGENETEIHLNPIWGGRKIVEEYEGLGFEKDERAPYHLLMKKEPLKTVEKEKDLDIRELEKPDPDDMIEQLAGLFIDISSRWSDRSQMVKEIRWSLEEEMCYLLGVKEGDVIGYCGLEKRDLFSGETMYWIKEVGVHPEERGKGTATEMIQRTINQMKEEGGNEAFIDTHSKNPARNLYKKLGFQVVEKVPNLIYKL